MRVLVADLRQQAADQPSEALKAAWQGARESGGSASGYEAWLDEQINQSAIAWMLATVFARFCEDNRATDAPFLAGPGGRLFAALARQQAYFRQHPDRGDRDLIVAALDALATSQLPPFACSTSCTARCGLYRSRTPRARELAFWRRLDEAGQLIHDFTDPGLGTDFLADVYADLSDLAKKAYSLVRTPDFVADLILDRTVAPPSMPSDRAA